MLPDTSNKGQMKSKSPERNQIRYPSKSEVERAAIYVAKKYDKTLRNLEKL